MAHPAAATCAHGTLQSIQCRVQSPCTVVPVTNAAGIGGISPCGTGVTTILNGDECTFLYSMFMTAFGSYVLQDCTDPLQFAAALDVTPSCSICKNPNQKLACACA